MGKLVWSVKTKWDLLFSIMDFVDVVQDIKELIILTNNANGYIHMEINM
jgi:hypothetical protein